MKIIKLNEEGGIATVELDGKTADLRAVWTRPGDFDGKYDRVTIYGFAVRYPTGAKVWSGHVTYWLKSGNIQGPETPLDHRARRASCSVVGFYADTNPAHRSTR